MRGDYKLRSIIIAILIAIFVGRAALSQDFKQISRSIEGTAYELSVLTTPEGEDYGYFFLETRWPSEANGNTIIHVCWENYNATFENDHQKVKAAVTATWQQNSMIEFRNWGRCDEYNRGIRISVMDDSPRSEKIGNELDGLKQGMVLNFTFNNWSHGCNSSSEERDYCIRAIAVHEFGHAIGFTHEHNRPDKPTNCREPASGPSDGAVMLTPYDLNSIMNYCNRKHNKDATLSMLDIDALHKVYGGK